MSRKPQRIAVVSAAVVLAAALASTAHTAPKVGQVLTVRVLRAKVMKAPRYIGTVETTLSRGEKLVFREAKGLWYRVDGAAAGWVHNSDVIESDLKLSSKPGGGVGASSDEVELAGRGFTPQVEGKYRQSNPNLDFRHVDAIEKTEVDPAALVDFVAAGGLGGGQ